MITKSLKSMLAERIPIVGLTVQHVTRPWLAKLFQNAGCNFVYIEYEHGFFDEGNLADFILCCRSEGMPVVAKVPECTRTHVAKLLDAGVSGIQLPWTETREQIDRLVSLVKLPPIGIRAAAPGYGNCDYAGSIDGTRFVDEMNSSTVILAHIETLSGVNNIDAILSNKQVDIAFIGMYDLSISCGQPGRFNHPDVRSAAQRIVSAAIHHSKVAGMYAPDAETAVEWVKAGVTFFELASEVDLIAHGSHKLLKEFRSICDVVPSRSA